MPASHPTVCVIIAAKNAAGTIGSAIGSALREDAVAEIIVVDDGSTDGTGRAARAADDGTGRLRVLRLEQNRGPAFARNRAIEASNAPVLAILDADDVFIEGRFEGLLQDDDWDFVADNIVFLDRLTALSAEDIEQFEPRPHFLTVSAFIEGNLSRPGVRRGELGFLKPVMRRSFLDRHGIRYNEALRLGEDYELYVRALSKGARYKVVHNCGYCAITRPDSLSGQHRTADLRSLYEADRCLEQCHGFPADALAALRRHARQTRARYELRRFLDLKAEGGIGKAALYGLRHPVAAPSIVRGIVRDKFAAFRGRFAGPGRKVLARRYLLSVASTVER
ncbi:MAG: glycosyltransferase family 2 protein [Rhizobiaceae bacterium]|nr:MAG: glycosyltransferase family 2 protein [Rhizobiaceae bacterium]